VEQLPLERLLSVKKGRERRRQHAAAGDQETRIDHLGLVRRDGPAICRFVEMRALDRGVEFDVLAQVEAVGDVLQPTLDFRLSGEPFAPIPPLVQLLGEEILVRRRFRIQASAGVAVPIPGSTDVGPGLERLHRQSLAAQKMQLVKTRDPCAYYDCVKRQRRLGIARGPLERRKVIHRLISLGFFIASAGTTRFRSAQDD
jgi:hypothetical protein